MSLYYKPSFNRTIVELKPICRSGALVGAFAFNRTIVELKPFREVRMQLLGTLLIEPLWN